MTYAGRGEGNRCLLLPLLHLASGIPNRWARAPTYVVVVPAFVYASATGVVVPLPYPLGRDVLLQEIAGGGLG
jgi:hypothetical protein